jgi:hypothetical protein
MTLPQPARAELREKIAHAIDGEVFGGLGRFRVENSVILDSVYRAADAILALTDAAYADFQGAELRDGQ